MTAVTERPASADIRSQLEEAGDKLRDLRTTPSDKRSDSFDRELRAATQEVLALDTEYTMAQRRESDDMQRAAWQYAIDNPPAPESRGPQAAFADLHGEQRSAGQLVVESKEYEARSGRGFEGVEVRNLLTSTSAGTSGSNLFVPVGTPFLSPGGLQRRRPFVRDLLAVQQTNLASVPYIRELNEVTNEAGATTVSEASAKPEVTMEFQSADAPLRKIAAWVQATNEALDDAPTLQGYIDTRLAYMLMIREEDQVISGDGTAPNISGILDNSPQTDTGELYTVIGTAAGKIEAVDGYPDGVVANPADFWAAVTDRHDTQFDGDANGTAPFGTPPPTVWGLPVIRSRALASGSALVGAWRLGATLFEKQGVTIRSTDSHASLFTSNTVVILAEERVGLAIHRPNWFVDCTVSAPS